MSIRINAGNPNLIYATRAPEIPFTLNPTYAAVCMAVAPGTVWLSTTPFLKVSSSSHLVAVYRHLFNIFNHGWSAEGSQKTKY